MRLPRFYPILDTETAERRSCGMVAVAEAMLEGGARMLQLRHKRWFTREALDHARRIAELCNQIAALLVVNDRADIARLLGAGLHVGQNDLPPVDARRLLGQAAVVGHSAHNETQMTAAGAEPVDYIALGPIFETGSKQNPDPVLGVEELRRLRPLVAQPLVAIGGITRETAPAVFEAGADALAVIGDLWPEEASKAAIRARVEEWMRIADCS